MIITFSDRTTKYIGNVRGENLKHAILQGKEWIEIDGDLIKTSTIVSVKGDKTSVDNKHLLSAPTTELTDEQRAVNIERIKQMKLEYLGRHDGNNL